MNFWENFYTYSVWFLYINGIIAPLDNFKLYRKNPVFVYLIVKTKNIGFLFDMDWYRTYRVERWNFIHTINGYCLIKKKIKKRDRQELVRAEEVQFFNPVIPILGGFNFQNISMVSRRRIFCWFQISFVICA